jgi:hypothetical protein
MIKSVGPGKSHIIYQFVAAVTTDPKKEPLGSLTFFGTKAISYPGGDRFQVHYAHITPIRIYNTYTHV